MILLPISVLHITVCALALWPRIIQKPNIIGNCYIKMAESTIDQQQTDKLINDDQQEEHAGLITSYVQEIVQSPVNLVLVLLIAFLLYKIIKSSTQSAPLAIPREPELPKLRKDFTVQELKPYDGTGPDGRVLVAVMGNVYDVTKGKKFYGPGGNYAAFGGRDATRGLATFSVSTTNDEYDDLSDLDAMEMDSVREWEAQFKEKYYLVGRLLKPGEQHTNYSDEEDEKENVSSTSDKPKDE